MKANQDIIPFPLPGKDRANYRLTDQCYLACDNCFTNSGPYGARGLSTEGAKQLIGSLKGWGIERVHFTGGEPFVRNDTPELISYATGIGLRSSVLSTGYRIPDLGAPTLRLLDRAQISVDGRQEYHDSHRKNLVGKGSYGIAIAAIEHLRRNDVPVEISATISLQNTKELEHVADLASQYGAKVIVRGKIPLGRATGMDYSIEGTSQQIHEAVLQEKARLEDMFGNDIFTQDIFDFVPLQPGMANRHSPAVTISPQGTILSPDGKTISLVELIREAA